RSIAPWCYSVLLLDAASGRDNLLTSAGADLEALHRHRLRDLAVREHFHRALVDPNEPGRGERLTRHLATQGRQIVEPHDLVVLMEVIRETALWQAPGDGHLAAFEMWLAAARTVMARTRLDTLVTLA